MKKISAILLLLATYLLASAQVTTNPTFITKGYTDEFTVIFDATKGDAGMVGATTCYAHTGVITTASTSDTDWKHAPTWKDNSAKYQLESIGTDLWQLTITGGMKEYYGLSDTEEVTKLAFVFRDATASKQGKSSSGGDILYELYEDGLVMQVSEPLTGSFYKDGSSVPYNVTVSDATIATCTMTVDGAAQTINLTDGNATGTIDGLAIGSHTIKFSASNSSSSAEQEVEVFISSTEMEKPLPEGMQEGINYNKETKEITLLFRAPLSQDIYILGDFNNWQANEDYHMYYADTLFADEAAETRIFWRTFKVADTSKKYGFVYKVDGKVLTSDPYATVVLDPWNDKYISTAIRDASLPAYPSAISDVVVSVLVLDETPYEWQCTDFKIKDKTQLVVYELLVRDFTKSKNLNGVKAKLDYLQELGVNAIELMPVTEFDGNESWGYAPSHFFAYDKAYGTKKMYKQFIDECHKRGIAVIIDMVFNHATGNCPFARLYWNSSTSKPADNNPWMNVDAPHQFSVYNDFNHEYEGTRKYFKRSLKYWIDEFKVDGYRMDLVKGFTQKSGTESSYDGTRIKIIKDYYSAVQEASSNAVFILEHLGNYQEQKVLANAGMLPWRLMNENFCQASMGYSSNSTFVDAGGTGGMYDLQFVSYGESHDEERNMYKANVYGVSGIKGNEEVYLQRVPLNMAFVALLPGPKMMWEFQEMGYDYSINQCSGSSQIKEDCRTDAKKDIWTLKWDKDDDRMAAYNACAKIVRLRTRYPEYFTTKTVTTTNCGVANLNKIRRLDINYKDSQNSENDVDIIVLANYSPSASRTIAGNFSRTGVWYEYLTDTEVNITDAAADVAVEANTVKIFTSRKIVAPIVGVDDIKADNPDGIDVTIVPTVTNDKIYIYCSENILKTNVYGMSGELLISADGNVNEISLAGLDKGMYIVSVSCQGGKSVQKIIKE